MKKLLRRVCAVMLAVGAVAAPQASRADNGPVQMPGTNHWYEYISGGFTWQQAHDLAKSRTMPGMITHVVTFSSQAELDFANSLFGNPYYYIGARDIGPGEGYSRRWAWTEGPEAGMFFSLCERNRNGSDSGCTNVPGQFVAWTPTGEPTGGGETFAVVGYVGRRDWTDVSEGANGWPSVVLEFEPTVPSVPLSVLALPGDLAATITWVADLSGASSVNSYTVTASPGGQTCTTSGLSCIVTGLTNRQSYTFTVTATNSAGTSEPSVPSAAVIPLAPGFQVWSDDSVLALGSSTTLRFAQSAASASIAVTGSAKAGVTADSVGFGSAPFTASKAGIQKFTATYSVKVGKKTTKYTAATQLYVPSISGPMLKIKQGKSGKFSLQFMPPGAVVSIALSDGRTLTGTADSAGKASTTQVFNTRGAVTYTVTVAGVQVATGGLTVS